MYKHVSGERAWFQEGSSHILQEFMGEVGYVIWKQANKATLSKTTRV